MALAVVLALGGETYLSKSEALKLVFPNGEEVEERWVDADPDVHRALEERCGVSPSRFLVYLGRRDGKIAGYAMILREITKTLPATFIVGVDPAGAVTEVAVLSHEEHIGGECRKERFLRQFDGATAASNLKVGGGGGVLPMSGATMSCNAVARAVRRTALFVKLQLVDKLQAREPVRRKKLLMGSFLEITADGDAAAVEKAFDAVKRVEKAISNYDEASELSRLHRERAIEAGSDLLAFVNDSLRYAKETGGAFDPTVAPLVRLWGFKEGRHRVPVDAEIEVALKAVGMSKVKVDGRRVALPEGVELDPGAIGKGQGVDAAAVALREAGVTRALIDFGSTQLAMGRWAVEIRDPFVEGKSLGTLTLENETLSTSGGYEKFFEKDGKTYGHILDPRTGRPAERVAATSVVAPTGAESDALSTAVYVDGKIPAGRAALLVRPDRTVEVAESLRAKFRRSGE
ncbi:MAG TPA: FAD:protein FMN transferase [Planctomycetota bacterium]